MEVLDGDEVRLSSRGRYAERDIVQVLRHCLLILFKKLSCCLGSTNILVILHRHISSFLFFFLSLGMLIAQYLARFRVKKQKELEVFPFLFFPSFFSFLVFFFFNQLSL